MIFSLLACGAAEPDIGAAASPTWYDDVAPIVETHCSGCHQSGGVGFDLTSPDQATAMASAMAAAVEERRMPPWGAYETDACTPEHGWVDDRRLTDEEIATFTAWAEGGAPLGEGTGALTPGASETLEGDLEAAPAGSYASEGDEDEFFCFVADPGKIGRAHV